MVEVISDTSFLMLLTSNRIKNMNNLDVEIGHLEFIVPEIVIEELKHLCNDESKGCLLYTSPSPRDGLLSRMPSSA